SIQVLDHSHIGKEGGISGVIKHRSILGGDYKSRRLSRIQGLVAVLDARAMSSLDHADRYILVSVGPSQVHSYRIFRSLGSHPRRQLKNRHYLRTVLFGHRNRIGNMVGMPMAEQQQVEFFRKLVVLWILWILLKERINQNLCSLWGCDVNGRVTQPGDCQSIPLRHSASPPFLRFDSTSAGEAASARNQHFVEIVLRDEKAVIAEFG